MERHIVSETVKKLRHRLGETQEEFARRMNTAMVTIARWETSRPPRGKALMDLEELAKTTLITEYADIFAMAQRGEFAPLKRTIVAAEPAFKTQEEADAAIAMLRVYRNRDVYKKEYALLERALVSPRRDIEEIMTKMQAKADGLGAIVPLHQEGKTPEQIAKLLSLAPQDVIAFINTHAFRSLRKELEI